ncbi:unnamed protein product [Euphydryas editha]|uniref:Uncharacterized protein n=1 Tax=Euphydryas editha TaxID=104508 RepID=A0AAU9TGM9_EUPED|nr:unnamed protein product [Euphydryas editha]
MLLIFRVYLTLAGEEKETSPRKPAAQSLPTSDLTALLRYARHSMDMDIGETDGAGAADIAFPEPPHDNNVTAWYATLHATCRRPSWYKQAICTGLLHFLITQTGNDRLTSEGYGTGIRSRTLTQVSRIDMLEETLQLFINFSHTRVVY